MFTVLNTNGSRISYDYAKELLENGLDSVIISLHSNHSHKHESIRQRRGNFSEGLNAINIFRELRDLSYPKFILTTQTIVMKSNYEDIPNILDMVCKLEVDAHGLSYLEGDFEKLYMPSVKQILDIRKNIMPMALNRIKKHKFKSLILKYAAIKLLKKLYRGNTKRIELLSQGIYINRKGSFACRTPKGFVMILSDGSVLPCNMVEYTDGPILGNIKENNLKEVLESPEWKDFASKGYEFCRYCPTHLHFHIPISTTINKILPLLFNNPADEQKSIKRRIMEAI
jgi:MoaA/NifB/PqqE/SkfB family radical SAM enzyme